MHPPRADAGIVIAAAGAGRRFGGAKQFLEIQGRPLLHYSLDVFAGLDGVARIVLVVAGEEMAQARGIVDAWAASGGRRSLPIEVVAGGARRRDSVLRGLERLRGLVDLVLVHDAVRPLLTLEDARRVLEATRTLGAAVIGTRCQDSVKRARGGVIIEIIDELPRDEVWTVQTPQGSRLADLIEAYSREPEKDWTDEASALRASGVRVALVEGSRENLKITRAGDEALAERILAARPGAGL